MAVRKSTQKQKPKKILKAEYGIKEIVENSQAIFSGSVKTECVEAALKAEKIEKINVEEAKKIVEEFLKREVI